MRFIYVFEFMKENHGTIYVRDIIGGAVFLNIEHKSFEIVHSRFAITSGFSSIMGQIAV